MYSGYSLVFPFEYTNSPYVFTLYILVIEMKVTLTWEQGNLDLDLKGIEEKTSVLIHYLSLKLW